VSALEKKPVPGDDEILSRMQGHICRCCGYPNIVKAIAAPRPRRGSEHESRRTSSHAVARRRRQIIEPLEFGFGLKRRTFVQLLATGLMIFAAPVDSFSRNAAGGAAVAARETSANAFTSAKTVWSRCLREKLKSAKARARIHAGCREELRVPVERVLLVMSDTGLTPNDGNTAGSG